ncbi:MAG: hypothetical protein LBM96_08630 [Methanobrevibacter sp.]|jgi:hypothetical protein|nr:hypothetical protein [Candidatus Methanoflexus mossambicus]
MGEEKNLKPEEQPQAIKIEKYNSNVGHKLIIKSTRTSINVIAKSGKRFSEHDIQVKFLLGYYWREKLPVVESFLNVLEQTIKHALMTVYPHNKLFLEYKLSANDSLEDSSSITIELHKILVDDTDFEIVGNIIGLEGIDLRDNMSKITSFRRKIDTLVQKQI